MVIELKTSAAHWAQAFRVANRLTHTTNRRSNKNRPKRNRNAEIQLIRAGATRRRQRHRLSKIQSRHYVLEMIINRCWYLFLSRFAFAD